MKKNKASKVELERQAEPKLSGRKPKKETTPITKVNSLRLVHDLQVHQVELEMQNEELMRLRTRAEAAYHQYSDLYDFAPVGYFTLMPGGTIRKVNLAGANLLGTEQTMLINQRLGLFVSEESLSAFNNFLKNLVSDHGEETCELAFLKDGKELFWARVEATCFEGGQECRATMTDITERKQAEDALRASELRFRSLIENGRDNISLLAADGTLLWESPATERALGYEYDQFKGQDIFLLVHSDDIAKVQWQLEEVLRKPGNTAHGTFRLKHHDGSWRWMEGVATNLLDEPNVNAIVVNYRDVTERKFIEDALKTSEENYRDLVENSQSLICTHDLDGNLLSVNEAAVKLTGYSRAFLLRTNLKDALGPEGEEQFAAYLKQIKAAGQAQGSMKVRIANGQVRTWAYNNTLRAEGATGPIVRGAARDITERKQAEDALLESEERFHKAFRSSPVGMSITRASDGAYIDANDAFAKITGFSLEELKGHTSLELNITTPEQRWDYTHQISEQGFIYNKELTLKRKSGESCVALGSMEIIELNHETCVLSTAIDITERKQAEEALRESQQIIEGIINTIPMRVFWKDKNLVYLGCNTMFARDAGFADPKDITGKDDYEMGWHDQAELYRSADRQVIKSGSSKLYIEEPQTTPEGKTITLLTSKVPLQSFKGEVIGVLGTYMDITERKQAEATLAQSERAYRTLFENMPIGLYRTSAEGLILDANPALVKMFGYKDRESLMAKNIVDFYVDSANDEKFRNGMEKSNDLYNFEAEYRRLDGTTFWAEDHTHAVRDEVGIVLFYEGSLIDISLRKKAEELIRQYASDLELRVAERTTELVRANNIKDEFLANMSHELRTPLSGILGFSELLLEGVRGPMSENQQEAVKVIRSSGEFLLGLINDILDISKIEAGKFELHPENVEVDEICQSSLILIKQLADKKSIAVDYASPPVDTVIFADPRRLKQVLINLLNNAVKFTPEKETIKLEVHVDAREGLMRFSITDTGIGIKPEDQQKLFNPFVQLDSGLSRKYVGSGLGLSLVKKLVEMHGGRIELQSEFGRGSCFTVILPWDQKTVISR